MHIRHVIWEKCVFRFRVWFLVSKGCNGVSVTRVRPSSCNSLLAGWPVVLAGLAMGRKGGVIREITYQEKHSSLLSIPVHAWCDSSEVHVVLLHIVVIHLFYMTEPILFIDSYRNYVCRGRIVWLPILSNNAMLENTDYLSIREWCVILVQLGKIGYHSVRRQQVGPFFHRNTIYEHQSNSS